jgi:negative regulator of sigma E activity
MKLAALFSTLTLIGAAAVASLPSYAQTQAPPQNAVASTTSSAMPQQKMPAKSRPVSGQAVSSTDGSQAPAPSRTDMK